MSWLRSGIECSLPKPGYQSFSHPHTPEVLERISISLHSFREAFVGFRSLSAIWILFLHRFDLVWSKVGVTAQSLAVVSWEQSITASLGRW